jgi:hypothetical protein
VVPYRKATTIRKVRKSLPGIGWDEFMATTLCTSGKHPAAQILSGAVGAGTGFDLPEEGSAEHFLTLTTKLVILQEAEFFSRPGEVEFMEPRWSMQVERGKKIATYWSFRLLRPGRPWARFHVPLVWWPEFEFVLSALESSPLA